MIYYIMIKGTHEQIRIYMRNYMKIRYRKFMDKIIEYLGGKCVWCNSTKELQIDHKDKTTKLFNISTGIQKFSKEKIWKEVEKCQLLCRKCHRKKSVLSGDVQEAKHGNYTMRFRRNCHCDLCTEYCRKRKHGSHPIG